MAVLCLLAVLCVVSAVSSGPLTSKDCAAGPDVWCQDLHTATQCGKVSYCTEYVWKDDLEENPSSSLPHDIPTGDSFKKLSKLGLNLVESELLPLIVEGSLANPVSSTILQKDTDINRPKKPKKKKKKKNKKPKKPKKKKKNKKRKKKKKPKENKCSQCTNIMRKIKRTVPADGEEDEIKEALNTVCDENFKRRDIKACHRIVDSNVDAIAESLKGDEDAKDICTKISQC